MRKVKEVISAYDANGDGKLQFKEFVDMVHVGGFWDRSQSTCCDLPLTLAQLGCAGLVTKFRFK